MLNILEILLLILGIFCDKKEFVFVSLVYSCLFIFSSIFFRTTKAKLDNLNLLTHIVCLTLSIIFLVL